MSLLLPLSTPYFPLKYSELRKFYEKLCTLYVWIAWICRNIEYPELHKFDEKLRILDIWIIWICRKIEYPELRK